MGSWTRRGFGRVIGLATPPALIALSGLGTGVAARGGDPGGSDLWPEARKTLEFYRQHLPPHLRLARPTRRVADEAGTLVRSVDFPIMDRAVQVGAIKLVATFPTRDSADCSRQSIIVAGRWYEASIRNAFQANAVA